MLRSNTDQHATTDHRRPPRGASVGIRLTWLLGGWTNLVTRLSWIVVAAALALAVYAGFYTAQNVAVNTDTTDMLSEDLAFRQDYSAYTRAFPYFNGTIVIVVEGQTADLAEDGALRLYDRLLSNQDRFHSIFYPQGMEFFRQNGLLYMPISELRHFADRVAEAQPLIGSLTRDPSLRGLMSLLGTVITNSGDVAGGAEALAPIIERISAVVEAGAEGDSRHLSWTALMAARDDIPTRKRQILVVQPKLDFHSIAPAASSMSFIRNEAAALDLTQANGVDVRLTGSAALNTEELQSVASGAGLAGAISLIAVILLLIVGLRSFWLVVSVLITLLIGLVWTAAFAIATVGELNMVSVAFAVLFIGLGVDFGIHYALRYREDIVRGMATRGALREAARSVGGGLTISALAAAVAFLSFTPTNYTGVSELGIIAAAGMIIALFTSLTILPALLAIWPVKVSEVEDPVIRRPGPDAFSVRAEHWLQRHGRAVCLGALVLLIGSMLFVPSMQFDRNPLNLKDPASESVVTALDLIKDKSVGIDTINLVVDDREALERKAEELRDLPEVAKVVTINDYVPENQDAKLEIIDEVSLLLTPVLTTGEQLPPPTEASQRASMRSLRSQIDRTLASGEAGALAAPLRRLRTAIDDFLTAELQGQASLSQLQSDLMSGFAGRIRSLQASLQAETVTLESLPPGLRLRQISPNGDYRITVFPAEDTRENDALGRFVHAVRSVAPHATGGPVLEVMSGDAVVTAFAMASVIAAIAITLLLGLLLRRVFDILLILAPLVLAGCLTVAIAVIVGLPFNFANIIVLPLLLGLGVASGVHLVMRARREHSQEFLATSTPRAVLFSALTTVASFGSLALSPHQGTASMGQLLFVAISMTLLCALIVLPAMMAAFLRPEKL